MKHITFILTLILIMQSHVTIAQGSIGTIQANTNMALPDSYNYQEYVFPEGHDVGTCLGITNNTAVIENVFISQTHRHALGHPLLFTIGERPALFQLAITGSGASPDVVVEGSIGGVSQGTLCMSGPSILPATIDMSIPDMENYFTVTLPKSWIKTGLELTVTAGSTTQTVTSQQLNIGPYTEVNLTMFNLDVMDYNTSAPTSQIIADFLQEVASAIPASVIRFGTFPETFTFPELMVTNNTEQILRLSSGSEVEANGANEGAVNYAANEYLVSFQEALGEYASTISYGNTLNLQPGGWGGGRTFVGFDYDNIFIHELGHALSLPHWEGDYNVTIESEDSYLYPYGGETNDGGGIGETWTFIQDKNAFVNPKCEITVNGNQGKERSDCMQREVNCPEMRGNVQGPWEGFSDFSAYSMYQFLVGGDVYNSSVPYRGENASFQIPFQDGFPTLSLENGERIYTRFPGQPQDTGEESGVKLPGQEQLNQDAYMIYGTSHATQTQVDIIYEPIKYNGTILPNIDPTDPAMFSTLQNLEAEDAPELYEQNRDITLKLFYIDGSIKHVLVPFHSFAREYEDPYYGLGRSDLAYFAVAVPGDINLCKVEMYHRQFFIGSEDQDEPGNINYAPFNITAANFMDAAVLKAEVNYGCNCPGTSDYVEPGTPCNDGNPDTENDVEDGFCNCAGTPIVGCELVSNGQFPDNFAGWWTWGTTAAVVNGVASFTNIELGDAGMAQGPFELKQNETYSFNFVASANSNREIEVFVYLDESPFTLYSSKTFELTTTEQTFNLTFTMQQATTMDAAIEFYLGDNSADVFIDNVCAEKQCATTEIAYNGLDDDCDPTTLDDDLDQDGFAFANDCDDTDASINPDAPEIVGNDIDEDCNGFAEQTLPVAFLSFDAELVDQSVDLTWNVGVEINVLNYTVEHSVDGILFDPVGTVVADNSSEYMFTHNDPTLDDNYYRIKTTDLNGSISYSDTIAIDIMTSTYDLYQQDLKIYPNPSNGNVTIELSADETATVEILDISGKVVNTLKMKNKIQVESLNAGIYIVRVIISDRIAIHEKLIVQ